MAKIKKQKKKKKVKLDNFSGKKAQVLFLIFLSIVLVSSGQTMMKKGMSEISIGKMSEMLNPEKLIEVFTTPFVLLGFITYFFALAVWLVALSRADVSFMYPLLSLSYVVTGIFATVFLAETVSAARWVGILIIIAGCYFITKT